MAAITSAVIGVAGTVYASKQAKKQQKQSQNFAREQQKNLDPYEQYRPGAAAKLDALVNDPSTIVDSPEYKARMQAVQRQIAAQGYAGSGNALVAAAEAGGDVYQQAFDNLAMLSGANVGVQAKAGIASQAVANNQDSNNSRLSATAGITNNLTNLATTIGGRFNQPATAGPPGYNAPVAVGNNTYYPGG